MTDIVHDATTQGLIDENPTQVRYQPRQRVTVAGGGWKWQNVGSLTADQQGRLAFKGNVSDQDRRTLPDGRVVTVQGTIIHLSNGTVEAGWIAYVSDGTSWEVVRVIRRYDVRAEVIQHASGT